MKKHWSISTTVRSAERIRNFLIALNELNGEKWNQKTQIKYQVLLIQKRFYGLTNQFFNGLSRKQTALLNSTEDITFQQAKSIFNAKNYTDPAMRGRQSINPLKKMGLVNIVDQRVQITSLGRYLLQDDYDLGEMFFRSFLKWQLPNPDSGDFRAKDGFFIKPFVGTLHLIKLVNQKWQDLGREPKGISKVEFSIFVPTLIHYNDVDVQAQRIVDLRLACDRKSGRKQKEILNKYKINYVKELLIDATDEETNKLVSNLKDYGDNTIRYFRLTRFLYIRGGGFYVDLEQRRHIEINALLESDNAMPIEFDDKENYQAYISDINQPILPWETDISLRQIAKDIISDLQELKNELDRRSIGKPIFKYKSMNKLQASDLKDYIEELREKRRKFQEMLVHFESQHMESIKSYIEQLEKIHSYDGKKSIELERLATLALNALNDAFEINPNYPVGDDNEPTFTAPANKPDIECFYNEFNAVCEVTMLTDRSQWYNEGQPVMRHVRKFEEKFRDKNVYCLFVAPRLHQDTIETFWMSIKYGYRGKTQKIVPLSITQLIDVLKTLLSLKKQRKMFKHQELLSLYDIVIGLTENVKHSGEWVDKISNSICEWKEELLSRV